MSGLLSSTEFGVRPRVGVVVLTMGQRPEELTRAIRSVLAQQLVMLDIVVVGNGWRPVFLPAGVRGLHLAENVGIPAGRNAGAAKVSGEYIFFLDDDAELADPLFLAEGIKKLEADTSLGLLQPRITDPSGKETPRRWIPRLRKGQEAMLRVLLKQGIAARQQEQVEIPPLQQPMAGLPFVDPAAKGPDHPLIAQGKQRPIAARHERIQPRLQRL